MIITFSFTSLDLDPSWLIPSQTTHPRQALRAFHARGAGA